MDYLSYGWIFETRDSSSFILLHFLASQLGPIVYSIIIKARILAGCDITNEIAAIIEGLKCNP